MKINIFKFCPMCKYYLKRVKIDGRIRFVCQRCGWIRYKNPLPVVVCVAGGFIESGEYPQNACLRELKEETGLEREIVKLIGIYPYRGKIYDSSLIIAYEVAVKTEILKISNELKEAKFISREKLPGIYFSCHRKIIKDV